MIEVRMTALLAKRARSRAQQLSVEYRPGLTPAAVARDEGFQGADLEGVLAVVNGRQAQLDTPLSDGDLVELLVGIAGG
jgi:molybdopterin converting factor small subunit